MFFKRNTWENKKVSIIVSTGRTGTKYFSSLFSNLPDFFAEHEPSPVGNVEGVMHIKGKLSEKQLVKFLKKSRYVTLKKLNKTKTKNYLESNGGLIYFTNVLHEVFPNLRVAHVIRDPRDIVRSGCSRIDYRTKDLKYLDESSWLLKSSEVQGDFYYDKWMEMDMAERFMWTWNMKNSFAHQQSLKHDNIKTFKFEDIMFNESSKTEFYKFLGHGVNYVSKDSTISDSNLELNKTSKFQFPEYENWSINHKEKLEEHCGELMKIYGYQI